MNGIRPLALSLQRLLSLNGKDCSREEFEFCLVHRNTKIVPVSPGEKGIGVDCLKQKEILDESMDFNRSLGDFLESFKTDSPKMKIDLPGLLHRTTLSSPSMSSLRKRRNTMLNNR